MAHTEMLFDVPAIDPQKSEHRCRTCKHIFSHEYTRRFKYCIKQKSNRTGNGYKKIKANDNACNLYEKR